jgi:predicted nucleic acid-binding protein
MKEYLIDANIIHAWANRNDKHHDVCKIFLEENKENQFHFPMHACFEIYASIARRRKGNDFIGPENNISLKGNVSHDIDEKFFAKCKENKLFDLFKELKGSDLIYACFAKVLNLPLVTCDNDFDIYTSEIQIVKLK